MTEKSLPNLPVQLTKQEIRRQAIRTIYRTPFTLGLGTLGALLGAYLLVVQPSAGALWYLVLGLFAVAMAYLNRAGEIRDANRSEIDRAKVAQYEQERADLQYQSDLRAEQAAQESDILRTAPDSEEAQLIRNKWEELRLVRDAIERGERQKRIAEYESALVK